jgi:hypothetical protein
VKRSLFLVLVGSVVFNAALGIYALLAGEFGDLEQKILFTSLSVSAAGVLALACAPAWERRLVLPLPPIGAGSALAGLALVIAAIWIGEPPEWLSNSAWTLAVVAVFGASGSLLALGRLAPRFRWVLPAALAAGAVLSVMIVSAVWTEPDSEWFGRILGVVAVLFAAFTVLVPIFHRASRAELAAPSAAPEGAPVRFCPHCGEPLEAQAETETACPACGARFAVRFPSVTARAA